jgi:hypothetical protein
MTDWELCPVMLGYINHHHTGEGKMGDDSPKVSEEK